MKIFTKKKDKNKENVERIFFYTPKEFKLVSILFTSLLICLITIFILPKDILSRFDILNSFVNFMSTFIPNIKVVATKSEIPESATFYMSLGIVYGALFAIFYLLLSIPIILRYYGVGKYKDDPYIFRENNVKDIIREDSKYLKTSIFVPFILIYYYTEFLFGGHFEGEIILIKPDNLLANRPTMLISIGLFSVGFMAIFAASITRIVTIFIIWIKMPDLYRKYLKRKKS